MAEGNEDGKPHAGSRPGPSNGSITVQKAGIGWCSVMAFIYRKLAIQNSDK